MGPGLLLVVCICHLLAAVFAGYEGKLAMAIMLFAFSVGDAAMIHMAMQK